MSVNDLNKRRRKILTAVVESYIKSANQISSRYIAKEYNFGLSSATIRNEMAELEDMGYLTHPHTSAGRMPTDKGYRYYIDELMMFQKLSIDEIRKIRENFESKIKVLENVISVTGSLLSDLSSQTSLILYPKLDKSTFKHVELIRLENNKVLIVLMTNTGILKDSIVELDESISQSQLQKISSFLNHELYNMLLTEIKDYLNKKIIQERDTLYRLFKDTISIFSLLFENLKEDKIIMEGIDHILDNPEFKDLEKSRLVFKMLSRKKKIINFMKKNMETDSLSIYIGEELPKDLLSGCSIITSCYKILDKSVGCLGILGPTRMDYSKIIPLVKFVSKQVSDVLTELEK